MPPTLDYGLKGCMAELTKDSRWNVLTILILHANIRGRCWVGMDTIALMATNNTPRKASKAKKWLHEHGAFTLVPYDKRVEEECELPARQHVYQLTGSITIDGVVYPYMYHTVDNVSTIGNFDDEPLANVSTIGNIKVSNGRNSNGGNGSISNKRNSSHSKRKPKTPDPITMAAKHLIQEWADTVGRFGSADTQMRLKQAKEMLAWSDPPTPEEVKATVLEQLPKPRKGEYEFGYLRDDIRERRALALTAEMRAKTQKAQSKVAIEKAEFHIAMMLGSQEASDDPAA